MIRDKVSGLSSGRYQLNTYQGIDYFIYSRPKFLCTMQYTGVNLLQKEEDFVWGIFRVLQGRIPTKFDNLKKNN